MTAAMPEHRAAGWYQDPADPTRLQHWSGRGWSGRSRSWPDWAISVADLVAEPGAGGRDGGPVLEGPVRPAPQPTISGRGSLLDHRSRARVRQVSQPPGTAGRLRDRRLDPGDDPTVVARRRPVGVVISLVALAVLMMAATVVSVTRPAGQASSAVGRDAAFVARAVSVCQAGLTPLQSSGGATMAAPGDTAGAAARADREATTVAAVEDRLRDLPVATDAVTAVGDWLDTWDQYVTDERQTAAALRATPTGAATPGQGQLAMRVLADVHRADMFAGANALSSCSLSPAATPGIVAIP
jgi:hypothetical protein